jgi:hypothetical protein
MMFIAATVRSDDKPLMLFYYSNDCEHCINIKNDFLPDFLGKYNKHFNFIELEISEIANFDSLCAMESRVDFPEEDKEFPAVYFMGKMYEGETHIKLNLEKHVLNYLANPDSLRKADNDVLGQTPEIVDMESITAEKIIHMAYFYKKGCKECSRASEIIEWLDSIYGVVKIDRFDIETRENKITATALGLRAGLPANRLMSTPIFFIGGKDYLLSEDISKKSLAEMILKHSKTGVPPDWESFAPEEISDAEEFIEDQFNSFAFLAVALAGLGDGINPCAFATILFFVSYLGMVGRKKNEILIVGIVFAFAVFITYLTVGLGFMQFIKTIANIEFLAKIIFGGAAVVCIIFGFLSIYDFFQAHNGNAAEMKLQLPMFLKQRIHKTIREKARMKSIVAGAMIAGFMVSILEFACTGQVYLPTITFMVGVEGITSTAIRYLLLYNVSFILPLLMVFAVVYFGVSSQTVSRIMRERVGTVKLILAGVFFAVGGSLFWAAFY